MSKENGILTADDCDHKDSVIRYKLDRLGRRTYHTQCRACGWWGKRGAQALPLDDLAARGATPDLVPPFDEVAFARAKDLRQTERGIATADMKRAEQAERAAYYSSPEWQTKRMRVFARAKGVCEGCGVAPATQVHHLSYEHFGNELLWELAAICDDCHERTHVDHKKSFMERYRALRAEAAKLSGN